MKQVYVLRHAEKSFMGGISNKAKEQCKEVAKRLPKFDVVISSQKERCVETAFAITRQQPNLDERANIENASGAELVNLITETVQRIRDGETALIISHVPCMPPARYILKKENAPSTYDNLAGFIVDDNMNVQEFK